MPIRGFKIELKKDEEIIKKLSKFDKKVRRQALKRAHRKAGREVVKMVRARVPKDTRTLEKSIGLVVRERDGIPYTVVGVRSDYSRIVQGRQIIPITYAFIVEARTPFMRPVLDSAGSVILPIFRKEILSEVNAAGG